MKTIIAALAAGVFLTGCVSSPGPESRPPNYVTSQATQSPGMRNNEPRRVFRRLIGLDSTRPSA